MTMLETPSAEDRPLLSACLIVRDEEVDLPRCLAALAGAVDEIVVHDTGSQDDTVAIARAAGALVIEGTWENDFGAARNVALAACTGEWILHVDADEELRGDPAALRAVLASGHLAEVDACLVVIDNLDEDGAVGIRHRACRIFRRAAAQWEGRVHEQVVSRTGSPLRPLELTGVGIRHHGYVRAARAARGKVGRNVALAEAAVRDADPADAARLQLDLARSLAAEGRYEDAIAWCDAAKRLPAPPAVRAWLHRFAAEVCLMLGRPSDAQAWVRDLRDLGLGSEVADLLDGTALLMLGRGAEALSLLEALGESWDVTGISAPEHLARQRRGLARAATGDHAGAAAELLAVVRERPASPVWGPLALVALRSNGEVGVAEVAEAVPDAHLRAVLLQLVLANPDGAEAVGQQLWQARGPDPRLLAFAVHHAPRLDTTRALEWSARLRAASLPHHCPLVARSGCMDLPPLERLLAAATAHGAFGDDRAVPAIEGVAAEVDPRDLTDALQLLDQLSPALLPTFVLAAASNGERALALADSLESLGASEQAGLLRTAV